jgi:hypothetical protein
MSRIIRLKASEPNQSSYLVAEMIPAYRSAAQESGQYLPLIRNGITSAIKPNSAIKLTPFADAGLGKQSRQQITVQGRITNGTLFPNISAAVKMDMKAQVEKTFSGLLKALKPIFKLIRSDIDMALAAASQHLDGAGNIDPEEQRRKEELAAAVQELKRQHAELLANVADI